MIGSHTATPRSYLRQFARAQSPSDRRPRLWVYQRGALPFCSTPERVGKENGYFAVTRPDGRRDESMEKVLSGLEGRGAALLPLINCETYVMSSRDVETIFGYMSLMFARTTARRGLNATMLGHIRDAYKDLAADPTWLQEQAAAYERFSGAVTNPKDISASTARVLVKLAKPEYANNNFVQGLLRIAETIFAELHGKPWQIWEAPEPAQFITTDNPVVTLGPSPWGSYSPGWGFRTPGVTVLFPISNRCCFVTGGGIGPGRRYWRKATVKDVKSVNEALVMSMDRWAYSATLDADLEWLVNNLGGSVKYGVSAFVPSWMSSAEDIKARVRSVIRPRAPEVKPARTGPQEPSHNATEYN
jgi:uncharacterized protein DUF4238